MYGGALGIGLGLLNGTAFLSYFYPHSPMLYNAQVYGGLALFGGYTLFDT